MYNTFYNFSETPFNVTPDPKFLYLTESHKEALASMVYGINERKGFISVTGEVGTGKTTLIYTLLGNVNEKVNTVFIFHTNSTFEQLLKNILYELDIPIGDGDKTTLLHKLNDYLIKRSRQDETLAIIIDEAQNLPNHVMEDLRMLSNLETSQSKLLQILLVGQPELERKLNSEDLRQLKQRIGIRRQIKPLSQEESKNYIDHRLNLAGNNSAKVFTSEAISLICTYAKGIPRSINVLCDNAFLIGYSESKKRIDARIIEEVISDMQASTSECIDVQTERQQTPVVLPLSKIQSRYHTLPVSVLSIVCLVLLILLGKGYFQTSPTPEENDSTHTKKSAVSDSIKSSPDKNADIGQIKTGTVSDNHYLSQDLEPSTVQIPQDISVSSPLLQNTQKENAGAIIEKEDSTIHFATVQKGDTVFYLAKQYYGRPSTTLADLLLEANPEITDAHLIKAGQHIRIPKITEDLFIILTQDDRYEIHVGTFRTAHYAYLYAQKLAMIGKEVKVIPRKISPHDTWYRVMLGTFETRDQSLESINRLKEKELLKYL